jgi:hypothetical protein
MQRLYGLAEMGSGFVGAFNGYSAYGVVPAC